MAQLGRRLGAPDHRFRLLRKLIIVLGNIEQHLLGLRIVHLVRLGMRLLGARASSQGF
jgi:hypothetical protein